MTPYLRKKAAAAYCGVSPRKFHDLLKTGLRHVRVPPGGTILTRVEWIDEYLKQFEVDVDPNRLDAIVDDVLADIGPRVRMR